MKTLLVIPARYASRRFPGKPLVALRGAAGEARILIRRTWEAARQVSDISRIVVATDDGRIREACEGFGAEVIMTSDRHLNGTERCAEAAEILGGHDVVINLQGDAPLTPPWFIDALLASMSDPGIHVATCVLKTDAVALARLRSDRKQGRIGGTTAVFDARGNALYFSKEVLPHDGKTVFHHVGVYAYRTDVLRRYPHWPEGPLEKAEKLEQLRFLENTVPVRCVPVDAKGREFWELNNPEDVGIVERLLKEQGMP